MQSWKRERFGRNLPEARANNETVGSYEGVKMCQVSVACLLHVRHVACWSCCRTHLRDHLWDTGQSENCGSKTTRQRFTAWQVEKCPSRVNTKASKKGLQENHKKTHIFMPGLGLAFAWLLFLIDSYSISCAAFRWTMMDWHARSHIRALNSHAQSEILTELWNRVMVSEAKVQA